MGSIWFILGGIILRMNPEWFNGGSLIGLILLIFGGFIVLIEALIFLGFIAAFKD